MNLGFVMHDREGRLLTYREHVEDALHFQRENPASVLVRRVSDGAVIAIKRGRRWAGIEAEAAS
jgi:hypothetical protein